MAQVVFDVSRSAAHLVDQVGAAYTLCGRIIISWGPALPPSRSSWPAQPAPWCQLCQDAYDGPE
ncbi:MAG: hypothetical protein JWN95_1683 [Frankiales bacterium]|nr:hypothetical protein [Frankiales bacterium]